MIQLGQEVKDTVTGFTGIVTAINVYLNGCVSCCVKPPCKDGKMLDGEYIDEEQLVVVSEGIYVEPDSTGGPLPDIPPDHYSG